jgi:hypothetical protein
VVFLPSVLRPYRFPCVLPLAALAVTTVFLTVATGALVAYPARYRRSGLMTFLVNHQGTIYEKDLGLRTTDIGMEMTSFDPDSTWRRLKRAVQFPSAPR